MLRYRFANDLECGPDDVCWPDALARAYKAKVRPACLCKPAAQATMYIASSKSGHMLKRMPNSGPIHHARCDHYDPPAELSGLGQVAGSAIREDPDRGVTMLTLDFTLTKGQARTARGVEAVELNSVRADGKKLTLRATLHYLLDQAHLTRWAPEMDGCRTWTVFHREITKAASNKMAKGERLDDILFIPEPFSLERKSEIAERRAARLARLNASSSARMLLIGEVKEIESARYGHHLVIKHMPDARLRVSEDLYKRMQRQFKYQVAMHLELTEKHGTKLLLVGTFSQPMQGIFDLESASMINVNRGLIPFDSMHEFQLLEALSNRRFTKALRYNLPSDAALASAILQDSAGPIALFIVPSGVSEVVQKAYFDLASSSPISSWLWNSQDTAIPHLPEPIFALHSGLGTPPTGPEWSGFEEGTH